MERTVGFSASVAGRAGVWGVDRMPLEISEIGVHLAVGQSPAPAADSSPRSGRRDEPEPTLSPEQIVEHCVQEVLRILERREER